MKITVYRKAGCLWSAAVIGFLEALDLPFTVKNMTASPRYLNELRKKSGQTMSPSLDIDGVMIPDASVEAVAKVLEERGLVI